MKQSFYTCLFLLISVVSTAQNSLVFDANAELRNVAAFTKIEVANGIQLYLTQGKDRAVAVSAAEEQYIGKIKTEVSNGTLSITVENGNWGGWNWGNKKIKAYVSVTQLEKLSFSGGSVGKIVDSISVVDLRSSLSGGSILNGNFTGTNVTITLSGGSIATIAGKLNSISVDVNGGSIFKGTNLKVNDVTIDASGGSVVSVIAEKQLTVDASGGSVINYSGDAVVKTNASSGGSVIRKKN